MVAMARSLALVLSLLGTLVTATTHAQEQPMDADSTRNPSDGDGFGEWYLAGAITSATAGITMGALGIWATLRLESIDEEPRFVRFKEGVPGSFDACEAARLGVPNKDYRLLEGAKFPSEARAQCSDRDEMVAVQLVTLPATVVFSGLAAFLFAEAFGEGPDDLQIATEMGPDSFGLTASARF